MNMSIDAILIETASILVIVAILAIMQLYFTRVLLQNVLLRFNQLDENLAEALQATVQGLQGSAGVPGTPPGLQFLMGLLDNAKNQPPRDEEGKFTVIELKEKEKQDTSS
jgi:hypothetical protein